MDATTWHETDRRLRDEIAALRERERYGENVDAQIAPLVRERNVLHDERRQAEADLSASLPSGVTVSRWSHGRLLRRNRWGESYRSDKALGYRTIVVGRTPDGEIVHEEDVFGPVRYEPNTRNKIGGLGAYRETPPSDGQIAEAVRRTEAAILAARQ